MEGQNKDGEVGEVLFCCASKKQEKLLVMREGTEHKHRYSGATKHIPTSILIETDGERGCSGFLSS